MSEFPLVGYGITTLAERGRELSLAGKAEPPSLYDQRAKLQADIQKLREQLSDLNVAIKEYETFNKRKENKRG